MSEGTTLLLAAKSASRRANTRYLSNLTKTAHSGLRHEGGLKAVSVLVALIALVAWQNFAPPQPTTVTPRLESQNSLTRRQPRDDDKDLGRKQPTFDQDAKMRPILLSGHERALTQIKYARPNCQTARHPCDVPCADP